VRKKRDSGEAALGSLKELKVDRRPGRAVLAAPDHGRSWWQRILITGGVLATVLCVLAAGVLYWAWDKFDNITQIDLALSSPDAGQPRNWLLVGTDSREGIDPNDPNAAVFLGEAVHGKRTDTMMIARVDPPAGQIDLLSIPRDLWAPLAGSGEKGRINSAYLGDDGQQRLIDTIEGYFGFQVHHYAEVNFVGFQDLVNALDGVPIWFDTPMRDHGSGLDVGNSGCHVLDGFQALAFARGRYVEYFEDGAWRSDGTGDLGRMTRQQYFVRRVVDRTRSKMNVTDLGTINRVLDVAGRNMAIDRGVGPVDLLALGRAFATLEGDQIVGHALPVVGRTTSGGAQVLELLVDEAQPVLDIFRGVVADPVPASVVTVAVLNGSGIQGQAGQVTEALAAEGFAMAEAATAPQPVDATEIRFPPGLLAHADRLARQLDFTPALIEDPGVAGVVLVTGPDFGGVRPEAASFDAQALAARTPTTLVPSAPAPVTVPPPPTPDAPPGEPVGRLPGPSPEGTACA
jgi:polyisoprenyl-teichoic acid--peptidoglycan teichoic acid transferase